VQLECRQEELERERLARRGAPPQLPADLGSLYRDRVESLQRSLLDPAGRTEATEVLQGLIDRVEVRAAGKRQFEFELVGDLASMLELGLDSRTPARTGAGVLDGYRSSVNLVAGTGFEPVTFRL
jgi:site-specific DNA recombinase